MALKLYNTLTGKKEIFNPLKPPFVSLYQCGPTVYDEAHLGNLRTYITNDILRRVLEYDGLQVKQVMNITDIDDKTIRRSREEKTSLKELTVKYEKIFLSDADSLNILRPTLLIKATESIDIMIKLISKLLELGFAYGAKDGIYFDISKSENYGKLARLKIGNEAASRIIKDEYDKENPRDFALWKFHTEEDGDIFYDTPFGKGRPGWHIECSAMAMNALGEALDIHTGGQDLIFPHHTNEIAQSEAATGARFSRYWLHTGFVNMASDKMSKSLGNIITLRSLVEKNFHPIAFRYLALTLHYQTPMHFTWEALKAAQTALFKLIVHFSKLDSLKRNGKINTGYVEKFKGFIDDDLNTPQALALIWELVKDTDLSDSDKKATIENFDAVLGLDFEKLAKEFAEEQRLIPEEILSLAREREEARENKDFKKSDELREMINEKGYDIEDTGKGFLVKITHR